MVGRRWENTEDEWEMLNVVVVSRALIVSRDEN